MARLLSVLGKKTTTTIHTTIPSLPGVTYPGAAALTKAPLARAALPLPLATWAATAEAAAAAARAPLVWTQTGSAYYMCEWVSNIHKAKVHTVVRYVDTQMYVCINVVHRHKVQKHTYSYSRQCPNALWTSSLTSLLPHRVSDKIYGRVGDLVTVKYWSD